MELRILTFPLSLTGLRIRVFLEGRTWIRIFLEGRIRVSSIRSRQAAIRYVICIERQQFKVYFIRLDPDTGCFLRFESLSGFFLKVGFRSESTLLGSATLVCNDLIFTFEATLFRLLFLILDILSVNHQIEFKCIAIIFLFLYGLG